MTQFGEKTGSLFSKPARQSTWELTSNRGEEEGDGEKARNKIFELAKTTDFEDLDSLTRFETEFDDFAQDFGSHPSKVYESFVHHLARNSNRDFYEGKGYALLKWLLGSPHVQLFSHAVGPPLQDEEVYPLHDAIAKEKIDFLECLLDISKDTGLGITDILSLPDLNEKNCLHLAISGSLPCSAEIVRQCEGDIIMKKDKNGNTPLHVAMKLTSKSRGPMPRFPRANEKSNSSNIGRPMTPNQLDHTTPSVKIQSRDLDQAARRRGNEATSFDPHTIYQEMKKKAQVTQAGSENEFMIQLLTAINNAGRSPYQLRLQHFKVAPLKKGERKTPEALFQELLKEDIFKYLGNVDNVRKALYGTEGHEKELFLDMSDFNHSSYDFRGFINDLTDDIETLKAETNSEQQKDANQGKVVRKPKDLRNQSDNSPDKDSIDFEVILFYVRLPDFNNFKEPPHAEIRNLFLWLELRGVKIIRSLSIPDSTSIPMSDVLVEGAIVAKFEIEKFEWRKLDINLHILTESTNADKFTEVTLYSSGNWSVLYHWTSVDGLQKLTALHKVTIIIVQLNPTNDEEAHDSHAEHSKEYQTEIRARLKKLTFKDPEFNYEVEINKKWIFPVAPHEESNDPVVPNLKLVEQQVQCHDFLRKLQVARPPFKSAEETNYCQRLKELTSAPKPDYPDLRIKVAVIDNGADRIRKSIKRMIARGASFVTGGSENDDRTLPWWMVADPHGTQMASLIAKANPFCRLYIARVGKRRKDILPESAARAIDWAIDQKVDIISISWVIKTNPPVLQKAIARAVNRERVDGRRPILVFCSTADEGIYSGTVYPAAYPGTVTVAATDKYGHLQPESADGVNILVPGENIAADGPSYIEKDSPAGSGVSGSSVATASAAGIASLALLLLKTFNWNRGRQKEPEELNRFYTKEGILGVFDKMNAHVSGIQLSDLFPDNSKELPNAWQHTKFPARTEDRKKSTG